MEIAVLSLASRADVLDADGSSLFGPSRPHRCELRAASLLSNRYTSEDSDMALRRLNKSLTSFLTSSYYLPLDLSIYPSSPVLAGER